MQRSRHGLNARRQPCACNCEQVGGGRASPSLASASNGGNPPVKAQAWLPRYACPALSSAREPPPAGKAAAATATAAAGSSHIPDGGSRRRRR